MRMAGTRTACAQVVVALPGDGPADGGGAADAGGGAVGGIGGGGGGAPAAPSPPRLRLEPGVEYRVMRLTAADGSRSVQRMSKRKTDYGQECA